ncbi:MAG: hypothetical protein ACAH88_06425 [Roseimicrobium sp.]
MKAFFHVTACILIIVCCSSARVHAADPKAPAQKKETKKSTASLAALPFDRSAVVKVEAIRFKAPGETGKPDEQTGLDFSFMRRDEKPDLSKLRELTVKKAELTPAQIDKLIQCLYGKNEKMFSAACYFPHHLFLFYDASDNVINAVELCFSCTGVSASPHIPEKQWYHHDFRGLAKLCDECGIGLGSKTAEEYVRVLDAREEK